MGVVRGVVKVVGLGSGGSGSRECGVGCSGGRGGKANRNVLQ